IRRLGPCEMRRLQGFPGFCSLQWFGGWLRWHMEKDQACAVVLGQRARRPERGPGVIRKIRRVQNGLDRRHNLVLCSTVFWPGSVTARDRRALLAGVALRSTGCRCDRRVEKSREVIRGRV